MRNVWRDRLSRWFTPLARRIPLSPNAISVIACALNVTGAVCLHRGREEPRFFLIAIIFIALGGLSDALDGIVARVQHKESRYGDFLDHFLDRVSDTILLAAWLLGNRVGELLLVGAIVAVMLNGYIGTQLEATFRKRNYETVGRGEFVLALVVFPIVSFILAANGWSALRFASLTVAEWLTVVMIAFATLGIVQRFALAAKLERGA